MVSQHSFSTLISALKSWIRPLVTIGLVFILVFGQADAALAARSGGRVGGGSFRAPSRSYSAPRTYSSPNRGTYNNYGGGYYPGGGFGSFFLLPFFTFGGGFGGLFTLLIVISLANFLVQALRRNGEGAEAESLTSTVTVAKLQVGLLAGARGLKADLDKLADSADTSSAAGRAKVLQETTLSLLRHPEYWVYASAESSKLALSSAEAQFNQLALAERSKFSQETLSNVNGQRLGSSLNPASGSGTLLSGRSSDLLDGKGELAHGLGSDEYIVVTLIVGAQGKVELPTIVDTDGLKKAIQQLGAVASDRLLAIEVLWTPQAEGDTLSADDLLAEYPSLRLV